MKDIAKQVADSLPSLRASIVRETDRRLRGGAAIGIARNGEVLQETRDQQTGIPACRVLGRYDGAAVVPVPKIDPADSRGNVTSSMPERLDRK